MNILLITHVDWDAIDIGIAINLTNNIVVYRTIKEDVDVADIAKLFGGGGHKPAAGSQICANVNEAVISSIFGVTI